jgi:hypothetical protein
MFKSIVKIGGKENIASAEEALRDIRERIEHCGGGPDELNKQVNAILDRYWKGKSK